MAWPDAAHLLRDLVAWEHRTLPYGGHWPWDRELLELPGQDPRAISAIAGGTPAAVVAGHRVMVRRVLWEAVWGLLPPDVALVASCVQPGCVRPVHGHVRPAVGRPASPDDVEPVAPSLQRWHAARPGWHGERRGQTDLLGRQVPLAEQLVGARGHLR